MQPVVARASTAPPVARAFTADPILGRVPTGQPGRAQTAPIIDPDPDAPIETASFLAPAYSLTTFDIDLTPVVSMPLVAPEDVGPVNVTVSFSTLPPAIAAAIAAAPKNQLALPPYVPAPNVGDPSEAIETMPVAKLELTEIVDTDATVPVERGEIEVFDARDVGVRDFNARDVGVRGFDLRTLGRNLARFAPAIGIVGLVLTFAIGFVIFDGEGAHPRRLAKAPSGGTANAAGATPRLARTALSNERTAAVDTKPNKTAAKATLAIETTTAPAKAIAKTEPKTVAKRSHGKLYISSNRAVQIFLDGKSVSATTPRQLRVRPGRHKVTLWDTVSGQTHSQEIDVPADKLVSVTKKFD